MPTCSKWKSQFAGIKVSRLAQLRELQEASARLQRRCAELALMPTALKHVVERTR